MQLGFYSESHSHYNGWGDYDSTVGPGWYVDDIVVTSVSPASGIIEFTDARCFVSESNTTATIRVERKYGTNGAVCVTYMASDGSAISGEDFDAVVDTLCWADGEGGVKSFTVPITQDTIVEGNETVNLTLAVPGAFDSVVARKTAQLVIVDDDGSGPTVTNIAYLRSLVGTANYVPTNTTSLFTVEGTATTYANLSLDPTNQLFFMQDGTNGIAVLYRGGAVQCLPQPGDRVRVTAPLSHTNGLLVLAPAFTNLNHVVWRVSSSNALPTPAALNFAGASTARMEATEASYVSASQVWIDQRGGAYFPTVLTNILITNQIGVTFDLVMHPALTNAGQLKPTGLVDIVGVLTQNDPTAPYTSNYGLQPTEIRVEPPGVLQFVTTSFVVLESGPAVMLTVSRTGGSKGPVSANFATSNGTAVASADFIATNGVLSWADGEVADKYITVSLLNDALEEQDEYFTVNLTGQYVGSKATAVITIVNDDFIVRPPLLVVNNGATAVFTVIPTSNTLGIQWWKDGQALANQINATLTIVNAQPADEGTYWVVVTTTAGAVTSTVARLVIAVPPTITVQPVSQTVSKGSPAVFTVGVSGTAPFTYQWRRDGLPLAGATNESLVFNSVQFADVGDYSVVVNNLANQPATSLSAVLTVEEGTPVPTNGLGSYIISNGCYVVTGSGEDIEGNEDRFFFMYRTLKGDGQIVANLGNMIPDNPLSEAGIMIRDGFLTRGERHVFLAMNANNRTVFRRRLAANYNSVENWNRGTNSAWLRLMRQGDTFSGHYSTNGVNWELVWWTTIPNLPTNLQAGLAVTAHRNEALATATFCDWSVGGLTPIPGPWPLPGPKLHLGGEPGDAAGLRSLNGFKMMLGGTVGDWLTVDYSTTLTNWNALSTVTNQYGVTPFLDLGAATNSHRFYRVRKVGP